ncbi:MAG: hypothetical protein Q8P25_02290 [Candidatus Curtissbacteria bacterium]|nr:hypothetical protein [Candidatus Curtissbacteria bacterium]
MKKKAFIEIDSFLDLVNSHLSKSKSIQELLNAVCGIETFLYKFPKPFCDYVRSRIVDYKYLQEIWKFKKRYFIPRIPVSSNLKLVKGIKRLIRSLEKRGGIVLFILHDGAIIRECFRLISPRGLAEFSIRVSRKELGYSKEESFKNYLEFFSEINKVASNEKNRDWNYFLRSYCSKINKRERNGSTKFKHLARLTIDEIERKIPSAIFKLRVPFTVVDTGLQGTFAVFTCYLLKRYRNVRDIDFRLLTCYPWLPSYFKSRSFSKELRYFQSIESSVINTYSKNLPFFGRIINGKNYRTEIKMLEKLLNG